MVTPGPATTTPAGDDPVNYVGYGYQDPEIRGFALTHFSGAGIHIGGELPFMPTTGAVSSSDPTDWASPYTHAQETAQPGYYSVMLQRYQVQAELTATTRTAVERYTFPATTQANVLLDVTRDNDSNQANPPNPGGTQNGAMQIGTDNRTVTGHVDVPGSDGITIYFTARFDRPFVAHGNWDDGGGWVTFDTTSNPTVGVRVGLSYTDAAGATNNLNAEAPDGTSFDAVKARAQAAWNARLHSIDVTGGPTSQQQTFYTRALPLAADADDVRRRRRSLPRLRRRGAHGRSRSSPLHRPVAVGHLPHADAAAHARGAGRRARRRHLAARRHRPEPRRDPEVGARQPRLLDHGW